MGSVLWHLKNIRIDFVNLDVLKTCLLKECIPFIDAHNLIFSSKYIHENSIELVTNLNWSTVLHK